MKKKVLVTGAGGYIGRYVVINLVKLGYDVTAVDINTEKLSEFQDSIRIISGSFMDNCDNPYEEYGQPDICIHLAWRNSFDHYADSHMEDLSSHYIFLKKLIDSGIEAISVMGTMHEIGYYKGEVNENTPCNPLSLYGIAKNTLRQSLLSATQKTETKLLWLRAFYILGDDGNNHSVFSKILDAESQGKETFPFTSGTNQYDFIRIDELGYQIALASTQTNITGIINVCNGCPRSLADAAEEFIRNNKLKIHLDYGAFPDRPYDSPAIWGNTEKINAIKAKFETVKKCY